METLNVIPRGSVEVGFSWNSETVDYRAGSTQKHRKRIKAMKTLTFTVSGKKDTMDYLIDFYNKMQGQYENFYFTYDGVTEICYFGDKLEVTEKREVQGKKNVRVVGFECTVNLIVESQASFYQYDDDMFPITPRLDVVEGTDWNTNILNMGANGRITTFVKPKKTFTLQLSGLTKDRNKLINMYNVYGDFKPIKFTYEGVVYDCYLPESITITDKRELTTVVGFECTLDLVSYTLPNDGNVKKKRNLNGSGA